MAEQSEIVYVKLAVEGIQKYICSTGKLKEMIGGSEIINKIAEDGFYGEILREEMGLEETTTLADMGGHYRVVQANAGTLGLLVANKEAAADFLRKASLNLLANYPGLPFYGAFAAFDIADKDKSRENYQKARGEVDVAIANQRNLGGVPSGCGLLPILVSARLDGLPAAAMEDDERLSLPSLAKSAPGLIKDADRRLRQNEIAPDGVTLVWENDLEKLLQGEKNKVALICIDGNDLGKMFKNRLEAAKGQSLMESIDAMSSLSKLVKDANEGAFAHACGLLAKYEVDRLKKLGRKVTPLVMPLRPLVMGGDDLTIIARADIALAFTIAFAKKFEEIGAGENLSVGIGMVVMDASYPFAKAFPLAESLQDNAKKLTAGFEPKQRPSSIDYLVLTEDVENDEKKVRQRLYTGAGGERLTAKPFIVTQKSSQSFRDLLSLEKVLLDGGKVVRDLPRSQVREAWTLVRQGRLAAKSHWLNLRENVKRGLGGRNGRLLTESEFLRIFPDNYFVAGVSAKNGAPVTLLGDYLELERLLPEGSMQDSLFQMVGVKENV